MNPALHRVIVQSILEVSKDEFGRRLPSVPRGFKSSLELILSDFRNLITVDAEEASTVDRPYLPEPGSRDDVLGGLPETPVLDSWLIWRNSSNGLGFECWWINSSFQNTVDFIEKVFQDPAVRDYSCLLNITWGTFLRYLCFISKNSEGWIPSNVEGGCSWEDHCWNVSNHLIECCAPEYWLNKFIKEEDSAVIGMNNPRMRLLGYLMPATSRLQERLAEFTRLVGRPSLADPDPDPDPDPEPEPEPELEPEVTPTQKSNESVRKLQEIIDAASRGEKPDLNEGEYLQLSQSLKGFFVSQ
jgi:hypothetical protein